MKYILLLAIAFCLVIVQNTTKAQTPIAHWGFSEGSGASTNESVSNTTFTIQSKWPTVEWVPGVANTAMRTDGYSAWSSGTLTGNLPTSNITITGWLALEVYPVTNSALWAQFDEASKQGAWIGVDKFGRLKAEFGSGSSVISFTSATSMGHYKWNYLVVNINAANGTITGYVNAVKVIDQTFSAASITWPSSKSTFIGKYPKTEMTGLYNINTMNAIIDEINIYSIALSQTDVTQLYQQSNPSAAPDMKTPVSRFASDFLRPKYHPIPASNWCNESHGLIYHNGRYHMFYQKNGNGGYLFQQNWGHLVSTNLLQWEEVQPALWPGPGWDNYGIWSGHVIKDQNNSPVIIYTGVDGVRAGIGRALPATADLLSWQKDATNPVIGNAPNTVPNKDFRDPYVYKEGNYWYMIVGSGLQSPNVGNVFLYKSADLSNWTYSGILYQGNNAQYNSGTFWEMPVFWKFGSKYMLMVNKTPENNDPARNFYWMGNFSNEVFTPDFAQAQNLELINWLLSPAVNTDANGRVTAIGIIPDLLPSSEQYKNGYANLFSLPREWSVLNNQLTQKPHPALAQLRGDSAVFNNVQVTTTGSGFLGSTAGFQKEIHASIMAGTSTQQAGFIIGRNATGTEYTKIYYNYQYNEITLDRTHHSTNANIPGDISSNYFVPGNGTATMDWDIYIDGSVVEVFINDKYTFSFRIYPTDAGSNQVDLFATGATAVANAKAWNINPLSVLPITWVSFTSEKQNSVVKLNWKVAEQVNNDHYEIQRSADGINFYSIGELRATGNTGGDYSFIDANPLPGGNYYKIKQVDKDGKFTWSTVRKQIFTKELKAYMTRPVQNPIKQVIELFFNYNVAKTNISLWDVSLRKLFELNKHNILQYQKINIPVKDLPVGLYFLKVTNDNIMETHTMVVN